MEKRITLLMAVLMFLCGCSLAQEGDRAVIFVRDGTTLHLRAEPTKESESLGLFFTGTQVECLSPLSDEWVRVSVGVQTGYMKGEYLRPRTDAEWIISEQPMGYIAASKTVNLRSGPSADEKLVGHISPDKTVLILGETKNHWYYIGLDGTYGYVSAKLVELLYNETSEICREDDVRQAYRTWIRENDQEGFSYDLIYVDDDDMPELAVNTGFEAGGCMILVSSDGQLDVLQTKRRGFTYVERGNLLLNADGVMDVYFDDVYAVRDGKWVSVAEGEYHGFIGEWDEARERYICQTYIWNGQKVTMEAYLAALDAAYPRTQAMKPSFEYTCEEILEQLN